MYPKSKRPKISISAKRVKVVGDIPQILSLLGAFIISLAEDLEKSTGVEAKDCAIEICDQLRIGVMGIIAADYSTSETVKQIEDMLTAVLKFAKRIEAAEKLKAKKKTKKVR